MPKGNNAEHHNTEHITQAFLELVETLVKPSFEQFLAERAAPADDRPALLRRKDAADYMAISVSSLDRLRKEGQIKTVTIGHERRYPRKELDRLIERELGT
ncbi:MAG: helix-turn-helix domain-containing protein [Planctomycetota bacterium]|jgi:excisionase family DNA binding protein